jgi:hypothetical protein
LSDAKGEERYLALSITVIGASVSKNNLIPS